jgi:hypothetical protein
MADDDKPLALLLLPAALEQFAYADHARDLLRAPRVVALEPPRLSWRAFGRMPDSIALGVAVRQAKRLKRHLPSTPVRVVVLYHALGLPLAEALLAGSGEAELWRAEVPGFAAPPAGASRRAQARVSELAAHAAARATFVFGPAGDATREAAGDAVASAGNEPLWERLEALGVAEFV